MRLTVLSWPSSSEQISLAAIKRTHQPEDAFRIGSRRYAQDDIVSVISREGILYVISGTYRFRSQGQTGGWVEIPEGCYASVPHGEFIIHCLDPRGAEIVYAIAIPERYRATAEKS